MPFDQGLQGGVWGIAETPVQDCTGPSECGYSANRGGRKKILIGTSLYHPPLHPNGGGSVARL